jgi:hypothetical protein
MSLHSWLDSRETSVIWQGTEKRSKWRMFSPCCICAGVNHEKVTDASFQQPEIPDHLTTSSPLTRTKVPPRISVIDDWIHCAGLQSLWSLLFLKVFLIILGISSRSSGISSYIKVAQLLLQRHSTRIADWCLRFQTFTILKESTDNQGALIAVFWSTRSLVEMVD